VTASGSRKAQLALLLRAISKPRQGRPVYSTSAATRSLLLFVFQRRGPGPPIELPARRAAEKQKEGWWVAGYKKVAPTGFFGPWVTPALARCRVRAADSAFPWRASARRKPEEHSVPRSRMIDPGAIEAPLKRVLFQGCAQGRINLRALTGAAPFDRLGKDVEITRASAKLGVRCIPPLWATVPMPRGR
jgi:hypothetical protein